MKSVIEFEVSGDNSGILELYPNTFNKIDFKTLLLSVITSFKDQKEKCNYNWEDYDFFIANCIKDCKLNISLDRVHEMVKEFNEMDAERRFYTAEDLKVKIDTINNLYLSYIKDIERVTDKRYKKDYLLK